MTRDNITLPREVMEKALEALEHYRSGEDYQPTPASEAIIALCTALVTAEQTNKAPAWWRDGLAATLMREGVNKHRAKEIAAGYWLAYCQIPKPKLSEDIEALRRENERLREALAKCVDAARDCALQHRIAADSMYDQAEAALRREESP